MSGEQSPELLLESLSALLKEIEQRTFKQLEVIHKAVLQQRCEIQDLAANLRGASGATLRSSASRKSNAEQDDVAVMPVRPSVSRQSSAYTSDEAVCGSIGGLGLSRSRSISMCASATETRRKQQLRSVRKSPIVDPVPPRNEVTVGTDASQDDLLNPSKKREWQVVLSAEGVPSVVVQEDDEAPAHTQDHTWHLGVKSLVDHPYFDVFWLGLIMLNAIFLGAQLQMYVTSGKSNVSNVIGETLFTSMFIVELSMRMWATGVRRYFFGPARAWAWLDVFVVSSATFDLVVTYSQIRLNGTVPPTSLLRMARALRIVKVLRGIRLMRQLRLLVAGMLNSVVALSWTLVAMFFLVFMGSIFVMSVVAEKIIEGSPYYVDNWGGLLTGMTTLFQVMSGDGWWSFVVAGLRDEFPALQLFFIWFYSVTALGLLNIVTGIFVEQTINASKTDADTVQEQRNEVKDAMTTFLTDVFQMMDTDDDGKVFFDEFEIYIKKPMVQFALDQIHLKADDVLNMFLHLDKSGDGAVDLNEFVQGCLRIRGSPTTGDVVEHGVRAASLLMLVIEELKGITGHMVTSNIETEDVHIKSSVAL